MKYLKLFFIALPLMAVLDLGWATVVAKDYYASQLGSLVTTHPVIWALVLFYLIYSFAIVYFAVIPGLKAHSLMLAAWNGVLLGLAAYGTYDLVNLGAIAGYPVSVTIVDIIWGMAVTKVVAAITYLIAKNHISFS